MEAFAARRAALLAQCAPRSLVVLYSGAEKIRSRDAHYPFRVDSDFYYLTGLAEPEVYAVLSNHPALPSFCLFMAPPDPKQAIWVGPRTDFATAKEQFGAEAVYPLTALDTQLQQWCASIEAVYLPHDQSWVLYRAPSWGWKREQWQDVDVILASLRVIKSPAELACLEQAVAVSVKAHAAVMQACRPGQYEYQLASIFQHRCWMEGGCELAYSSIVGGGVNACTLHYTRNEALIQPGDLVLVDAGAEYAYYAADITRTFPANGTFTPLQRQVYQLVLEAQLAGIQQVQVGQAWHGIQVAILQVLVAGLVDLGVLQGNVSDLIERKAYRDFYMHGSGHWLGMDVHDPGDYQQGKRLLEPNMVLTVEPGLYFGPGAPAELAGIGIRIEDDVVVTADGPQVLSAALPKSIEAIEQLMGSG